MYITIRKKTSDNTCFIATLSSLGLSQSSKPYIWTIFHQSMSFCCSVLKILSKLVIISDISSYILNIKQNLKNICSTEHDRLILDLRFLEIAIFPP